MPKGKRAFGAVGWHQPVPANVVDVDALLDWRRPDLPELTDAEKEQLCSTVMDELGRYRGWRLGTPQRTDTDRKKLLKKIRPGELAPTEVDSDTRAFLYASYKDRKLPMAYWPDRDLPWLIHQLGLIWKEATGHSPRTRAPDTAKFPFSDWIADLFEGIKEKPPSAYIIRNILSRYRVTPPEK